MQLNKEFLYISSTVTDEYHIIVYFVLILTRKNTRENSYFS